MSSDKNGNEGKDGKEGKESAIVKAAGVAVAAGVAWGIFRFVKARKEEDALIQEYYGDREDFTIPDAGKKDEEIDDVHVEEEEDVEVVTISPTPISAIAPKFEELKIEIREERIVIEESKSREPEPEPEPEVEEKPWFLSFLNPQKKKESKPKLKESEIFEAREFKPRESESYEIKRGDTLWAISGKYGVSLESLKTANDLHGDNIFAGDKLVIPPK